jgi:hypothetical protein
MRQHTKHQQALDQKLIDKRDHLGKYATARDIHARVLKLTRDALTRERKPTARKAGNRTSRGW